jgi:hypothetical protein
MKSHEICGLDWVSDKFETGEEMGRVERIRGHVCCLHGEEEGGAMGGKLGEEGSSASCRLLCSFVSLWLA